MVSTFSFYIILTLWTIAIIYGLKHYIAYRQLKITTISKQKIKIMSLLFLSSIILTGLQYNNYMTQGATPQKLVQNPYKLAQASNLAPNSYQVSSTKTLNQLTDDEMLNTIVVIYKFGCGSCQRLWMSTQTYTNLKPSKHVLWVPANQTTASQSELINQLDQFPSIITWKKENGHIQQYMIESPTDNQVSDLNKLALTYEKG